MKNYGPFSATSFKDGDRVEIGPHLDLWMRGARFGNVTKVTRKRVHIKLDALKRPVRIAPDDVFAIID